MARRRLKHSVSPRNARDSPRPDVILLDLNTPPERRFRDAENAVPECLPRGHPNRSLYLFEVSERQVPTRLMGADRYIEKSSQLEDFLTVGRAVKDMLTASTLPRSQLQ